MCLPLTSFDMFWIFANHVQRLLFYKHPCTAAQFTDTIIPHLKHSLSQTLRYYLPLAGNLHLPLDSGMPELRYLSGDSVAVTFAESNEVSNFDYLTGNQARDTDAFHLLVPELPESKIDSGFKRFPLLAIQITHFPATGIAIGITNHHVAGDANSIVGFLKAWSSTAKLGENNNTPPFYDRSEMKDPTGRAGICWNLVHGSNSKPSPSKASTPTNKVRATFVLKKSEIEKLQNVVKKDPDLRTHLSSFTVTAAYFWWCIVRSAAEAGEEIGEDEVEAFVFPVDARGRMEVPLPAGYFGNCVVIETVTSTHGKMKGEDGFVVAVKLIGNRIKEKVNKKKMVVSDAEEWLEKYAMLLGKRRFTVSGSPRFDLYGVNFGWGKPVKCEVVSIDKIPYMVSLCKSREFEGGLEIGVSLLKSTMDALATLFYDGLKNI